MRLYVHIPPCIYYGENVCNSSGDCDNDHFDCVSDCADPSGEDTTGKCPGDDTGDENTGGHKSSDNNNDKASTDQYYDHSSSDAKDNKNILKGTDRIPVNCNVKDCSGHEYVCPDDFSSECYRIINNGHNDNHKSKSNNNNDNNHSSDNHKSKSNSNNNNHKSSSGSTNLLDVQHLDLDNYLLLIYLLFPIRLQEHSHILTAEQMALYNPFYLL